MKNSLIAFLSIALVTWLGLNLLPWWIALVISFLASVGLDLRAMKSFIIPFLSVFILWFSLAALQNIANNEIMGTVVAEMFGLPNSWFVVGFGALLTGLLAGMAGYCGGLVRALYDKPKKDFSTV